MFRAGKIFAIALVLNAAAFGQSLGDVARANREQQQAQQTAVPKVITNADLPSDPSDTPTSDAPPRPANRSSDRKLAQDQLAQQRIAQHWRAQIQAQKNKVAELQARVDRLNAALHPAGGVVYDNPSSRYQARQLENLAQMQQMLDQQKQQLSAMQDEARRAGMHTAVYDP
jgi:DNA repair exonuclease SbcCD ATPase subunit